MPRSNKARHTANIQLSRKKSGITFTYTTERDHGRGTPSEKSVQHYYFHHIKLNRRILPSLKSSSDQAGKWEQSV